MNQAFNKFQQFETPVLVLCTPDKEEIYTLPLAYTIQNTVRYNAISELTFSYPRSKDGGTTTDPAYAFLKGKMLVLVPDVGYYIIQDPDEDSSGSVPIKSITALSLETELSSPRLTGFTGTYSFADLLQRVLDLKPTWTIGTIEASLLSLYRTFTSNNITAYNFLMVDMEKAYACIFEFDSFARTVSAISNVIPVANTNIYLSFDNLVKSIQFKEISSEICTAMYCYGGGSLDIRNVNPLGSNAIYDFSYFKTSEWMSQGLINALDAWELSVSTQQPIYAAKLTELETYSNQLLSLQISLTELNGQLKSMTDVREARVQQSLDTVAIDAQIAAQQILIASKGIDIAAQQLIVDSVNIELRKIVHSLFFTSRTSFHNFAEDTAEMTLIIQSLITSWMNVYTPTSTYPGFSPSLLATKTPEINTLMLSAGTNITILLNALLTGFSAYPLSVANVGIVTGYINNTLSVLNDLYSLLQSIIANTSVTVSIDDIRTQLTAYLDIITYSSNMTDAQLLELTNYIYENTYTNSNIITTESMTPVEVQTQSQTLYDQCINILAKASEPRYEFSGEYANFVALQGFSSFTSELELGKVINIKKDDTGAVIEAVLLELAISYDDPTSFGMTFSNRFRLDNSKFIYSEDRKSVV
jgi:hypothetical protein